MPRFAVDEKPSPLTRRFDGAWQAAISCPTTGKYKGYTRQIAAQVKDGNFHGQRDIEDKPNWLSVDGGIQLDGSAELFAQGVVGNRGAAGGLPTGTPYNFSVQAKFEGSVGTGTRTELRSCNFTALKRWITGARRPLAPLPHQIRLAPA
jgi:hypothetical protein